MPILKRPDNEPKDKSLESWIWDAACSIRGAKDAPKYKEFILTLILLAQMRVHNLKLPGIEGS